VATTTVARGATTTTCPTGTTAPAMTRPIAGVVEASAGIQAAATVVTAAVAAAATVAAVAAAAAAILRRLFAMGVLSRITWLTSRRKRTSYPLLSHPPSVPHRILHHPHLPRSWTLPLTASHVLPSLSSSTSPLSPLLSPPNIYPLRPTCLNSQPPSVNRPRVVSWQRQRRLCRKQSCQCAPAINVENRRNVVKNITAARNWNLPTTQMYPHRATAPPPKSRRTTKAASQTPGNVLREDHKNEGPYC